MSPVIWRRSGIPASNARHTKPAPPSEASNAWSTPGVRASRPTRTRSAAVELLQGGGAGAARDVGDDGDGVLGGLSPPLVEGGDDELDAAVGRLHDLVGDGRVSSGTAATISSARDRQRRRVEDLTVEQVGDLVQLLGEEPAGHDQPSVGGASSMRSTRMPHVAGVELMDVVDDDRAVARAVRRAAGRARRGVGARPPERRGAAATTCRTRSAPRSRVTAGAAGSLKPGQQGHSGASGCSSIVVARESWCPPGV